MIELAAVKGYWAIGKWIALGLLVVAASSFYMLWRSNVQTVEAQQTQIDGLTRERAQYAKQASDARTDYNNMVTKIDQRLETINKGLADHAVAISKINSRTLQQTTTLNQIRDQSDDSVKAVLATQLPQFACVLNDKFCAPTDGAAREAVRSEPVPAH